MIPLWVLSFLKCSAGSAFQLWTGPYINQGIARLAIDACVARPVQRCQGNRVIPTFQHGGITPQLNWQAALYCHGASVAREDVCSNQSNTLEFTYK